MQLRHLITRAVLLFTLASLIVAPGAFAQEAPSFTLTDLIKVAEEGTESIRGRVSAVNNDEVVIGFSSHLPEKWSPYIAIDDEVERIGSGELGASVTDINADGVIVGRTVTSRDPDLGAFGVPTVWEEGEPTELSMPASAAGVPAYTGIAHAINDDGIIVGEVWIDDADYTQFAVTWTDGVATTLPNAYGYEACLATDISENGAISGQCWNPNIGEWQATAWIDGAVIPLDHGSYAFGFAAGIVDDPITGQPYVTGQVATTQSEPDDTIAVIWDLTLGPGMGVLSELSAPEGLSFCSAEAINSVDGDIWAVGYCSQQDESDAWPTFAVLWAGGEAARLDDLTSDASAYQIEIAYDVNSNGSIAANAYKGDVMRGVVLRLED